MRNFLTLLFIILLQSTATSQSLLNYSSITLPDSLKKDADAVLRLEENEYTIVSRSKLVEKEKKIVTILTKNGLHHAKVYVFVDKLTKLEDITVKVYNDLGFETSKFRKKDFKLEGAVAENTLASDDKVYVLNLVVPGIPCTIETEKSVVRTGYLDLPDYSFKSTSESVVESRFIIKTNSTNEIKYKAYNTKIEPVISNDGDYKVYKWEAKNIPVVKREPGSRGIADYLARVDISPLYFDYDGYPGTMASWKDFGMWRFPFYDEPKPFSPEKIEFLKSLVKDIQTEEEKIATLYKYLQNETRYVFIAYGIGGLKPFPASFVESKKYGDCKALSNYMKHMLQAVGIKSYTASITAGPNNILFDPEFVSNRSNHIIVCVPLASKDTMWLECTSKQTRPGFLGSFTENRNALLITENGGVLVNTPVSKAENSKWISVTNAMIDEDGSALLESRVFVSGEFWPYIDAYVNGRSKEEIKKALVNAFGYKTPDDLEVKILADSADGHLVDIKLTYSQFFDFKAGSKYFYPQRQYKLNDETIKPAESRQFDFLFDYPYLKTDNITYKLPAGFARESIPATKEVTNDYVRYKNTINVKEDSNELHVITELQLHKHIIPPSKFNEVAESFELIKKDELQKLVLKKQ